MKVFALKVLFILVIPVLFSACLTKKSQNVDIIESATKMYVAGEPPVEFKSYGATYNFFSPNTIVVFKASYEVLGQKGIPGTVYRIDRNLKMNKLETFDTTMSNAEIAKKYLYFEHETDEEIDLEEVRLR